ncbi:MAG: hypothetical protein Q9164_007188, partial [Protoblastenia rupestris]
YPSSGKTHRSQQILEFFKSKIESSSDPCVNRISVHHVNNQILGLDREVYKEAKAEKDARAAEYSAVERLLGRNALVIADGLNYIKGFRYQLYCEAKAVRTPSCVDEEYDELTGLEVHVGTPIEKCRDINDRLLAVDENGGGYQHDTFENLVFRYEEPNGMTRWDSPLFTVTFDDEAPPHELIWEAMIGPEGKTKTVKPNLATVTAPATDSDYLYKLDRTTQDVLNKILEWQKDHPCEGGGKIAMTDGTITLPANPVTLPQLQRLRRHFITLNRQHKSQIDRIQGAFIEHLNDSFG